MPSFPILEDINLLVVKHPNEGPGTEKSYSDLKTAFDSLISLNIDEVFQIFDYEQINELSPQKLSQFTHVISDRIEFPQYEVITRKLMIPVVSKLWLRTVIKNKHVVPIRPFSPDPRHIFKDFTISSQDLGNEDDFEIVKVAVTVFGGSYIADLKKSLTHLVTNKLDTDSVRLVNAFNKVNVNGTHIHIVRPDWVFDCLRAGKLLPEKVYEVTDDIKRNNILSDPADQYLPKFNFEFSKNLHISSSMVECLSWIKTGDNSSEFETIVLSRFLEKHTKIKQRTFDFLFNLFFYKSDDLPNSLLFYPVPKLKNKEMEEAIVAISNYTGDARLYIEELLLRMGSKFTKTLKSTNTHLIASKKVGKKYDFSKKWNVSIVNHLWVEDCFVNWKKMDVSFYSNLPRTEENIRIIGDVEFLGTFGENSNNDENLAVKEKVDETKTTDSKAKKENVTTQISKDVDSKANPEKVKPVNSETNKTTKKAITPIVNPIETITPVEIGTEKKETSPEVEKIALTDTEKQTADEVWEIPDDKISTEEKTEEIGEEAEPKKKLKSTPKANPKKRQVEEDTILVTKKPKSSFKTKSKTDTIEVIEANEDATKSNSKKAADPAPKKSNGKPYNITAIVTGFDGSLSAGDKRELKKVGITIIENANKNLNCIIAPSLLRTQKFLTSLSFDPEYFLEPIFLNDVLGTLDSTKSTSEFEAIAPKVERYDIWNGIDYEKDIKPKNIFHKNITKFEAMKLMKKSKSSLFKGYSFNLSSGLAGGFDTLKLILKSFGCKSFSNFKENSKTMTVNTEKEISGSKEVAILISNENETKLQDHFIAKCVDMDVNYVIVKWDVIVMAIFEGELKFDNLINSSFK